MALKCFTPEMGEKEPNAEFSARLSPYGEHYYIKTPKDLKGQGVQFLGVLRADRLTEAAKHKTGWNEYKLTSNAFKKLCLKHEIALECILY